MSDGVIFVFVQLRDAALLFFDHRCELLHQRGRFLLFLLQLSEGCLVTLKVLGHLLTNLFDLLADQGHSIMDSPVINSSE